MPKHSTPIHPKTQEGTAALNGQLEMFPQTARATPIRAAAPVQPAELPALKQWFRIGECAVIFTVSEWQIRAWIDAGILDARAIGVDWETAKRTCVRVTRESVVRLLNDEKRKVT